MAKVLSAKLSSMQTGLPVPLFNRCQLLKERISLKSEPHFGMALYSRRKFFRLKVVPILARLCNHEKQSGSHGLVGCFGLNGPLRQYFSLYRAVSQREGDEK